MSVKSTTRALRSCNDILSQESPREFPSPSKSTVSLPSLPSRDDTSASSPTLCDELVKVAHQRNAEGAPSEYLSEKQKKDRQLGGLVVGGGLGILNMTTGLETTLHEYVGHGYLGGHLTSDYPEGREPVYQVDGWDNFQAMLDAEGPGETFGAFCDFIAGKDVGEDGAAGWAMVGHGEPNELGELMGADGQRAWISVSGSIPGVLINSLMVAGGMKLKDTSPATAYAMMTFGGVMHLNSSAYPFTAALMSPEELLVEGNSGHDFASFALRMSEITGLSPQAVAITTAGVWAGILPAVALGMYLHQKSSRNEIIPDRIALGHWLSTAGEDEKVSATFDKLYSNYSRKDTMQEIARRALVLQFKLETKLGDEATLKGELEEVQKDLIREQDKFNSYLIAKLPKGTLNKAREAVLVKWEKAQGNKKLKKAITAFQISGMTVAGLAGLFGVLGRTIVTGLAPVGAAMSYIFPFLQVGAAGLSTYETYRDWKSDDVRVPKSAKVISAIKTGVSYVTAILLIVGFFVPGMQVLVLPAVLVALVNGLGLGALKNRIIKGSFELEQATKPAEWNYMVARYENYLESFEGEKSSWSDVECNKMKAWVKLQKRAVKSDLLSELQVTRLKGLGIDLKPKVIAPSAGSSAVLCQVASESHQAQAAAA